MLLTLPSGRTVVGPVDPTSYTDQTPTVTGTAVTSGNLEYNVTAAVAFHRRRPLFQGLSNVSTSVPSATWTPLPLTEIIDTFAGHSDDTNPSRVYATDTNSDNDWYLCTGYVPFKASVATRIHIAGLRLDGGTVYEGVKIPGGSGHATDSIVVDLLRVPKGDYVELMAYQNTGSTLATESGANKCASLTMRWACNGTGTTAPYPGLPRTWTAADQITADLAGPGQVPLNTHIRDVARWLRYPPIARLHTQGTAQTITANTWTSIQFVGETVDNYGGHDNTVNNSRYTVQRPGLYYVYGLAAVAEPTGASGYRAARLLVNGTTPIGGMSSIPASDTTAGTALAACAQLRLNAGDYVELQLIHNQGTALSVRGGAGDHSRLIVVWRSL